MYTHNHNILYKKQQLVKTGYVEAVGVAPFDVAYVFNDVDDIYWAHEVLLNDLLHQHVPIKEKLVNKSTMSLH